MTAHPSEQGFTLIEILVVVLIIGVLAAIALPRFIGQTETAKDAEAKALARTLQSHVESCFVETEDWGQCDSEAELRSSMDFGTDPGEVQVLVRPFGRDIVAFAATSKTGSMFAIFHGTRDRATDRICFVPAGAYPTGACKRGGPFANMGFGTW